jgi:hypothetical protein
LHTFARAAIGSEASRLRDDGAAQFSFISCNQEEMYTYKLSGLVLLLCHHRMHAVFTIQRAAAGTRLALIRRALRFITVSRK